MALSKKWIDVVRRKLHRSSHPDYVHPHGKSVSFEEESAALPVPVPSGKKDLTKRDVAAVKIQAFLRGYLVRRAFRARRGPRTERLGKSENCFKIVQRKLRKSSHTKNTESISIEEANVSEEISSYEEPSGTVSLTTLSPETETTTEDSAAISKTFPIDDSISTSSKKKRRGKSMNCFNILRRRSHKEILYPNGDAPSNSTEEVAKEESIDIEGPIKTASSTISSAKNEEAAEETACFVDVNGEASSTLPSEMKKFSKEDTAARSDEINEPPTKKTVNFADANGAASSTGPSKDPSLTASSSSPKTEMISEDSAAVSETLRTGNSIAASSKRKTASSTTSSAKNEETTEETAFYVAFNAEVSSTRSLEKKDSPIEDTAAKSNERDEELAKETVNFANANGAVSSPKTEMTKEDSAAVTETCRTDDIISTSSKKKRRGKSMNCFNVIRRRSHREILHPNGNTKDETSSAQNEEMTQETACFVDVNGEASSTLSSEKKDFTKEDTAARSGERNEKPTKETVNFADASCAASSTVPSEDPRVRSSSSSPKTEMTREDSAVVREKKTSKKKRTGTPQNCFNVLRRRSHRAVLSTNGDIPSNSTEEAIAEEESIGIQGPNETASSTKPEETTEEPTNLVNVIGEGSSTLSSEKITAEVSERFRAGDAISTSSEKKRTGKPQKCFNGLLRRRSRRSVLSPDSSIPSRSSEEAIAEGERDDTEPPIETASPTPSSGTKEDTANVVNVNGKASSEKKELTKEDTAARSNPKNEELDKERVDPANTDGVASPTMPSEKKHSTTEHIAAIKIQAIFRGHLLRRTSGAREKTETSSKKKRKETPKNRFGRRFRWRSTKGTISPRSNAGRSSSTEEPLVKEATIKCKDAYGPASSTPSSPHEDLTKHVAATKIQAFFRGHRARRAFQSLKGLVSSSRRNEHRRRTPRGSRNWFDAVRRKLRKKSHRDIMIPVTNPCARISTDEAFATEETADFGSADDEFPSTPPSAKKGYLSGEDAAAIKIQAVFRGHLARRAYAALKGLVKLQAVVRGASVRRQARIAQNCMHALARLQVRVRGRQLLNGD